MHAWHDVYVDDEVTDAFPVVIEASRGSIDDRIIAVSIRDPAVNHYTDHSELPQRI